MPHYAAMSRDRGTRYRRNAIRARGCRGYSRNLIGRRLACFGNELLIAYLRSLKPVTE
jgi:hypothetical protein